MIKKKTSKKSTAASIEGQAELLRQSINKGAKKALFTLQKDEYEDVPCVSTGFPEIDFILSGKKDGTGGFPRGSIVEVSGPPGVLKSSLVYLTIGQVQARGGGTALVDAEHAYTRGVARKRYQVVASKLLYNQPDTGEEGLDAAYFAIKQKGMDLVAVDSVAALIPKAELTGKGVAMGAHAVMMSKGMRKIQAAANEKGPAIIFVNQIRKKPGVMFGNPEYTTGGEALYYYSHIRIDMRRIKTHTIAVAGRKKKIGVRIRIVCTKNRFTDPFREVEMDVMFRKGVKMVPKEVAKEDRKKALKEYQHGKK